MVKVSKHSVPETGRENVRVCPTLYFLLTLFWVKGIVVSAGLTGRYGGTMTEVITAVAILVLIIGGFALIAISEVKK